MSTLPRATETFIRFGQLLRLNGFAVAPDQSMTFVEAVGLLGPKNIADIHRAAHATLAPAPERRDEFDALFRHHFLGQSLAAPDLSPSEEDTDVSEARDGDMEPPDLDEPEEAGQDATGAERLFDRQFAAQARTNLLRRFERDVPSRLPRRRAYRRRAARHGDALHMRRALKDAARRDGEFVTLPKRRRITRQKRLLLLIDVSGSMKAGTDNSLRVAHALARAAERLEIFTIGTRLTRITRALRRRNDEQALAAVSHVVADFDGGTRLGAALDAFLAIPRFAGFARGAVVIVLSDGLERGDHRPLEDAVARLHRLADSITWLSPLAQSDTFTPQTAALQAIAPLTKNFGSAASPEHIVQSLLTLPGSPR